MDTRGYERRLYDGDDRYIIVEGMTQEQLVAEVNINLGRYAPLGGVAKDATRYCQAMIMRDTAAAGLRGTVAVRRGGKRSTTTRKHKTKK